MGINILSHFPQEKGSEGVHVIQVEHIDTSFPWDFLDGASQGDYICGGGALLFL